MELSRARTWGAVIVNGECLLKFTVVRASPHKWLWLAQGPGAVELSMISLCSATAPPTPGRLSR